MRSLPAARTGQMLQHREDREQGQQTGRFDSIPASCVPWGRTDSFQSRSSSGARHSSSPGRKVGSVRALWRRLREEAPLSAAAARGGPIMLRAERLDTRWGCQPQSSSNQSEPGAERKKKPDRVKTTTRFRRWKSFLQNLKIMEAARSGFFFF